MWVAYLNLENTYGQPPDEAVMKLFQRALQHVDQKKLYLALLAILESSKKACPLTACEKRSRLSTCSTWRCWPPHDHSHKKTIELDR